MGIYKKKAKAKDEEEVKKPVRVTAKLERTKGTSRLTRLGTQVKGSRWVDHSSLEDKRIRGGVLMVRP